MTKTEHVLPTQAARDPCRTRTPEEAWPVHGIVFDNPGGEKLPVKVTVESEMLRSDF
jgi:hypothetical protein